MRYEFEAEPFELGEIEGEFENDEFEYGRDEEYGSDSEFEVGVRDIINRPKRVNRETYEEFEFGDELSEEISPPSDTRVPVKDTLPVPFRFICHLAIKFKSEDGKQQAIGLGSGTLIGNKHVLTVGHSIKVKLDGTVFKAESISVSPAMNTMAPLLKRRPFGSVTASSWNAHPKWISSMDPQCDYGLITLKKEIGKETFRELGKKPLGFWGSSSYGGKTRFAAVDPAALKDVIVNVGGYPGDKCGDKPTSSSCPADKEGGTQYCGYDKVLDPSPASQPRMIWHNVDSKGGQSGAPVWRWEKASGERRLVAIHRSGVLDMSDKFLRNTAVRISGDVLKQLTAWGWRV